MRGIESGCRYYFEPDGPFLDRSLFKAEESLLYEASGRFQLQVHGTN